MLSKWYFESLTKNLKDDEITLSKMTSFHDVKQVQEKHVHMIILKAFKIFTFVIVNNKNAFATLLGEQATHDHKRKIFETFQVYGWLSGEDSTLSYVKSFILLQSVVLKNLSGFILLSVGLFQ